MIPACDAILEEVLDCLVASACGDLMVEVPPSLITPSLPAMLPSPPTQYEGTSTPSDGVLKSAEPPRFLKTFYMYLVFLYSMIQSFEATKIKQDPHHDTRHLSHRLHGCAASRERS